MADTVFAIAQDLQNRQPHRVGQNLQQLYLGFIGLCFNRRIVYHIQNLE